MGCSRPVGGVGIGDSDLSGAERWTRSFASVATRSPEAFLVGTPAEALVAGETAVKDLLDLTDADTPSCSVSSKLLDPVEDVVDGRTPYGD